MNNYLKINVFFNKTLCDKNIKDSYFKFDFLKLDLFP